MEARIPQSESAAIRRPTLWSFIERPGDGRRTGRINYSGLIDAVCRDIVAKVPEFSHIRMDDVLVTLIRNRKPTSFGLQARLTALRFKGGATRTVRNGRIWEAADVRINGRLMRYILSVPTPRFQDQPVDHKTFTLIHELYHISPRFDGDMRRFEGRYAFHSASHEDFDRKVKELQDVYEARRPDPELMELLKLTFHEAYVRFGAVAGVRFATPKLRLIGPAPPDSPRVSPPVRRRS